MERAILVLLLGIVLGAVLMPTLAFASPSSSSSFQSKVAMINKIPIQKVTVGDIDIAYKQPGNRNAKPIILITGNGVTMDTWSPLLLEQLISSNYYVTIFWNTMTLAIVFLFIFSLFNAKIHSS